VLWEMLPLEVADRWKRWSGRMYEEGVGGLSDSACTGWATDGAMGGWKPVGKGGASVRCLDGGGVWAFEVWTLAMELCNA